MSTNTLCRLCGKNTKDYIDIFDENGVKKDLGVKASSCLNINVYPNDVLPKIMCVACCARLDDLYEFFVRSTNVQLILRTLCQSNETIIDVRAEHDYAIKTPTEGWFTAGKNLPKTEYAGALENCSSNDARQRVRNLYENDSSEEFPSQTNNENSNREQTFLDNARERVDCENEHNYYAQTSRLRENESRMELEEETEHNYNVRLDRGIIENRNRSESFGEPRLNDAFQDSALSQLLEGYSWSCTICEDEKCFIQPTKSFKSNLALGKIIFEKI